MRKSITAAVLLALALSSRARAETLIDIFTGNVTSSNDPSFPVGTAITGQVSFDFDVATFNGVLQSPSGWIAYTGGQTLISNGAISSPYETALVFSQTIRAGSALLTTAQFTPAAAAAAVNYDYTAYIMGEGNSLSAQSDLAYPASTSGPGGEINNYFSGDPFTPAGGGGTLTDWNGHIVSYSTTFMMRVPASPAAMLSDLGTQVVGVGPGKSLADKVLITQADYAANDIGAACPMLTGFIQEVDAQTGKKIARMLAARLIAYAETIQGAIGCQP